MILFLYSPDARDVAFFSPSCRRLSSVCVLCVCWGFIQSLPCTISFPTLFFGGVGNPTTTSLLRLSIRCFFFSFSYFSSTPFVDLFYIRQFQLPFILFFTRPLYLFFLYLLCGRVRLIYIYIHILLCVYILSLGRKKKKGNNKFLATFFSPFHVVYTTTIFYTQFIFISQLNSQIKIIDNKEKRKKKERKNNTKQIFVTCRRLFKYYRRDYYGPTGLSCRGVQRARRSEHSTIGCCFFFLFFFLSYCICVGLFFLFYLLTLPAEIFFYYNRHILYYYY